jgi:hypothetical protein
VSAAEPRDNAAQSLAGRFGRHALDRVAVPVLIAVVAGYAGARVNERLDARHALDISVIRADQAASQQTAPFFLDPFAQVQPTPTPDPDPTYTYTAIVRNTGDYAERHVTILVTLDLAVQGAAPRSAPEVEASSPLLAAAITPEAGLADRSTFGLSTEIMAPGEWISLKTSWGQTATVHVDVRSDDVADSS